MPYDDATGKNVVAPVGKLSWGWGFNQTTNYVPSPPYYAIYPPVYYSPFITARHYGASPFAWYPGMQPITYVPEPDVADARGRHQLQDRIQHAEAGAQDGNDDHVGGHAAALRRAERCVHGDG